MNDLVSILIPVYNRETLIQDAVQSALRQTYSNIEVIIVDNASTDSTVEVVRQIGKRDDRVRLHVNSTNVGPVLNWKVALGLARGVYAKFLWSDDWIADGFLEKTLPYLQDPRVAFAFSPAWIVNGSTQKLQYRLYTTDRLLASSEFYRRSLFAGGTPYSPACGIFRTRDIQKYLLTEIPNRDGLLFSRFGAGNDLLMFLLPLLDYELFAYVATTRAYFRAHGGSFSATADLSLYYDYAKLYFLACLGQRRLLRKFKTRLVASDWRLKKRANLIASISAVPMVGDLIIQFLRRLYDIIGSRLRGLIDSRD